MQRLLVLLEGDLSIKNQVQVTKNYSFLKSINLLDTNTENEASSSKESENETLIIRMGHVRIIPVKQVVVLPSIRIIL